MEYGRGYIMSDVIQYIGKNVKLGENVMKWHFTYIGDNTEIGDNTKIGSLVHIDYNVKIGKDCKIEGMAYIPPLTRIGDRVFIGPIMSPRYPEENPAAVSNNPITRRDRKAVIVFE